jgi:hypothetical protein
LDPRRNDRNIHLLCRTGSKKHAIEKMYIHPQKAMGDGAEVPLMPRANIELQPTIIIVRREKKTLAADIFTTADGRRLRELVEHPIETGAAEPISTVTNTVSCALHGVFADATQLS